MVDREENLSDVLSEFARTLVTDFPIQGILDHLVKRIVEILPVTGAGVTLIDAGLAPEYVAASDGAALRYEQLQTELGEGPCLAAYKSDEAVSVPDLSTDDRFPAFAPAAVAEGLRAVFTFPLRQGDRQLGALDLYRSEAGPLDDRDMAAAQTLADVATAYLLNAQARADLRDSTERFRESSLHDALTGLPNRILFNQLLHHAVLRGRRSNKLVAILFADLDRFKEVNDTYGHRVGDELLIAVADRLTSLLRPGDTLARLSGDEFIILCDDLDDAAQAQAVAGRVIAALLEPFRLEHATLVMSASVGIAFAGRGEDVPEQFISDADAAMYQAKRKGGARAEIIDLRALQVTQDRARLERDLHGATGRGEMRAEYQPIVTTADGRIRGVEALLRWEHPVRGIVPPLTVVPLAEQHGLITEIGGWMLEQACRDRRLWQNDPLADDLQISVNVSPHQLMARDFCSTVGSVLRGTATPPERVTLEVTESVFIEDGERALGVLEDLKGIGVVLALDDFGIGYSSLGYLRRFPVDVLKIDRLFIAELGREGKSSAIVSGLVDLAHALGMSVVAEGVETAEQHREVAALGCESSQGFYFAHPMPAAELEMQLHGNTSIGLRYPRGDTTGESASTA